MTEPLGGGGRRGIAALIAGVLAIVLLPLVGSAAPAGAATEDFTLAMTAGELWIRDAAEPAEISLPTTVSGTNTDGVLSGIDFSTPTISFRQDVPDYGTHADIDAAFSMVGLGSGTINENGDVTVQIGVTVDLHIVVPILTGAYDCRATPINLTLVSTEPYDGETVTLSAPNFTVPEVSTASPCGSLVGPAVNGALAGGGHSISMTFAGDVTLPAAGEPTVTSLEVAPEGSARVGQEVTLTATIEPANEDDEAPEEWIGSVSFFDGAAGLGTVEVGADGKALLTTTALGAGTRSLRAVFSGAPPDWQPSRSPIVAYVVTAAPLVSTDLAGGIIRGTERDFTVSVRNTGLGAALDNARLDVEFGRTLPGGTVLSSVGLAHVVDGAPVPVALSGSGTSSEPRGGSIVSDAWLVPAGGEVTETLRLTVPAAVGPGVVRFSFELVTVDDGEDVVLSSVTAEVVITAEERFPTTLTAGLAGSPGFPPFVPPTPAVAPVTPVVRQGTVAEVVGLTIGPAQGVNPKGTVRFSIGGRPVVARFTSHQGLVPWSDPAPVLAEVTGATYHLVVPADMAIGDTVVQVRYSGDDVYAGSEATWPITIEPGLGVPYDCVYGGIAAGRFVANLEMQAQIAPVGVRGAELPVARVEARLHLSRTREHSAASAQFGAATATYDFALTGGGTGAFEGFSQSGGTAMDAAGTPPVDWTMVLSGGSGTLPVVHDAGTTEAIEVEGLTIDASSGGFQFEVNCVPFDEHGVQVASVTSVGTSLTVTPGEVVRQGDEVELTAQALPASPGVVEFLDGDTTVGVSPVNGDGVARVTAANLPPGTRSLTARYIGTVFPSSTSDPVELTVEGIDCFTFAESGSAAVVRLVYLTVLNRCPDQAGFDFWVERLDGGATRESVARAIAASHEARKVLVDDAYELMLERRADAEGKEFWATRLGQTGSYRDLIGHLGSSPEFRTLAGGTDARVVERLYDRLLHRSPSAEDTTFWVGQIQARGTRATVIRMFDLDEPLSTLVGDTYRTIVDRAPTTVERDAGVELMRSRSDRAALNAQAINTNDFYTRAQGFPNVSG